MNKYETIFLLNIKLLEKDQKKILDKIIKLFYNCNRIMHIFYFSGLVARIEMWPPSFVEGAPSVAQSDFVGYFCGIEN